MEVKILSSWILLVATVMLPVVTVEASASGAGMAVASRARHGGCNFRIVRDILRRACAYHSSENSQLLGLDSNPANNLGNELSVRNSLAGTADDSGESYPHHDYSGVRIKKEIELLYIRRILKECCPADGCPPLSKFCN